MLTEAELTTGLMNQTWFGIPMHGSDAKIVGVLALSFSPYWVEKLAQFFEFGTPSMAVVALAIAGLVTVAVILLVMISDLKRKHALLTRQVASMQLKLSHLEKHSVEDQIST